MQLTELQKEQIANAAKACYPEEMCGVLLEDKFAAIENSAEDKLTHFKLDALALVPYLGKIKAIVHSHTLRRTRPSVEDARTPSIADVRAQQQAGVPFLIVATDGDKVTDPLEYPKPYSSELIGRPFVWFVHDCYTLVQDYYFREFGVLLPAHKADADFREIKNQNDIFEKHILAYGFVKVDNLDGIKNGDLLLLDGMQGKKNHLAIYHNGKALHQAAMSIEVPMETFAGRIHCRLVYVG